MRTGPVWSWSAFPVPDFLPPSTPLPLHFNPTAHQALPHISGGWGKQKEYGELFKIRGAINQDSSLNR
jgi:hypothetical protein